MSKVVNFFLIRNNYYGDEGTTFFEPQDKPHGLECVGETPEDLRELKYHN